MRNLYYFFQSKCNNLEERNCLKKRFRWSDQLLLETPESVQKRLDVFLSRGITVGQRISRIVKQCPEILFARDAQSMDQTWEDISAFFFSQNVEHEIYLE